MQGILPSDLPSLPSLVQDGEVESQNLTSCFPFRTQEGSAYKGTENQQPLQQLHLWGTQRTINMHTNKFRHVQAYAKEPSLPIGIYYISLSLFPVNA